MIHKHPTFAKKNNKTIYRERRSSSKTKLVKGSKVGFLVGPWQDRGFAFAGMELIFVVFDCG
jgi:hypothetical protein